MIELVHYDDGKQKLRSHKVGLDKESNYLTDTEEQLLGYGETYQEALDDFVKKLDSYIGQFKLLRKNIHNVKPIQISSQEN